ncbi:hypothetical protein [Undibacterium sp.]|jgi:hypothetical protein|uniref:hypothetical protein n=1 Tax=Undibacterium sp. TaxID=1914977 RepID=UPI002CF4558F|nr:hypothetical protein [Undibacterium sp.]HTD03446.1 hypothetical protein [Undibacterium sp.]
MKKNILIIFVSFALLLILNSALIAQLSKGQQYAKSAVYTSKEVGLNVGNVKHIILLGSSYSDDSVTTCRTLNYLIVGDKENTYLEVSIETIDTEKELWMISKMQRGYFTKKIIYEIPRHKVKCR